MFASYLLGAGIRRPLTTHNLLCTESTNEPKIVVVPTLKTVVHHANTTPLDTVQITKKLSAVSSKVSAVFTGPDLGLSSFDVYRCWDSAISLPIPTVSVMYSAEIEYPRRREPDVA